MNATSVVERVRVADGGRQIASQVGTHLVGGLAQKLGIPSALSAAMSTTVQRRSRHDRGRVLTQIAMTLAAGGRCISDVAVLRNQPSLFGQVASDATVWRVVDAIDDEVRDELRSARANVTASLLDRLDPGELILDVDASVFEVHSENKEGAAPHFKGGFGFHPLFVFAEPVGVPLAGRLRPGNANANNATDQLQVIDDAIAALPDQWQAGHRDGDDPGEVVHQIVVRTDIAGYSHKVIGGLHGRNLAFSIGMPANEAFDGHIHRLGHDDWRPALDGDGRPRKGAQVAELEAVPDWMPEGTRVIVRRERPHPGAQLKLWDHDGWRHQVIVTNQTGDPTLLEARHRAHAQVENRIKNLKDIGQSRFPFARFTSNAAWLQLMLVAALLLAATQTLLLEGELAVAEPRRLRHTILHAAARVARRSRQTWLRLADNWPWSPQLLGAYHRLAALQPAPG
ncbi:MAG: IS1380 family transposase [Actinobacteria bacterium]|nr:IS1380 family transposase [Actinomycetota bacterium]